MNRSRITKNFREIQLFAIAGFISSFIFLSQLNLQEILRFDRLQHSVISLFLFFLFYSILAGQRGRVFFSIFGVLLVGIGKEFMDHSAQNFDMYANAFGVFLGLLFIIAFPIFNAKTRV